MDTTTITNDPFFTSLGVNITEYSLPDKFTLMLENTPHPLCLLAAEQLQHYLSDQKDWSHNFGLLNDDEQIIIGKMFGVLVVQNQQKEIGYLAAFSGKLAGGNIHTKFVPPIFDALTDNSFLNLGMTELTHKNQEIRKLQAQKPNVDEVIIKALKTARKNHSVLLQQELFKHYFFLNESGERKSAHVIFHDAFYKDPPSGAGECATPKLLQYAFQHQMKPMAIAEFWWGQSPKSAHWKHGHFYPCCKEKCEPILAHMLKGIVHQWK